MVKRRNPLLPAVVLLATACGLPCAADAQVIEERKASEPNPATAIFRSTLYGAGTGLLLGGAYALVEDDDDVSTGDALKWGLAGGIAGGALIGLIYVVARPEPKGDVEDLQKESPKEMIHSGGASPRLLRPGFMLAPTRDASGGSPFELRVSLFNVRF